MPSVFQEIVSADPKDVRMFLAGVLKLSREFGNPFFGDGFHLSLGPLPPGAVDVRDDDHDKDEIYHVFLGGLHCTIIEALAIVTKAGEICHKALKLIQQNFFDYFFDKHRGCTSCIKRVLALMPEVERNRFLLARVQSRVAAYERAYAGTIRHSPTCMELSLWLLQISPLDEADRQRSERVIAGWNHYDAEYLREYSHQRSVRKLLGRFV